MVCVVEWVLMFDLISDGCVEMGIGEGLSVMELYFFECCFCDKCDVWEDVVWVCLFMFWNEGWEYYGEYFDFLLCNVVFKFL